MYFPLPGTSLTMIDTPALLIDLDLMESNIKRLFERVAGTGIHIRPHLKTVKTPVLAHRFLQAGAKGVCVAKLGEAEVMAASGIEDILITTEVIGGVKLARLMSLLCQHRNVKVVVDSIEGVDALAEASTHWGVTAQVLIEIDVGQRRCGVAPGNATVELAKRIVGQESLCFMGVQGYEGHLQHIQDKVERTARCVAAMELLTDTTTALSKAGMPPTIVTTGGTGTWQICAEYRHAGITEVQPGSFVFMDADYRHAIGNEYANALSVLATVISRPSATNAVVDAGLKALSNDSGNAEPKNLPGVSYQNWGDEHGILSWEQGTDLELKVGDKIELIPSHCDTTINLYDHYFATRDSQLEVVWPISARGKTQ